MNTITLGELLSPEQAEAVRQILITTKDDLETTRKLKAYLVPLRAELEKKGMLPEFLAYAILATFQKQQAEAVRSFKNN